MPGADDIERCSEHAQKMADRRPILCHAFEEIKTTDITGLRVEM